MHKHDGDPLHLYKLPSTAKAPERTIVEGFRLILENNGLPAFGLKRFAHGTTDGANARIQRKCVKFALVTREGFRDLLEIGR